MDWALSKRGQAVYQNQKILLYGSLRTDAGPMPTGKRLADFKLLPTDWNDYVESHPVFVKEESIMGCEGARGAPRPGRRACGGLGAPEPPI